MVTIGDNSVEKDMVAVRIFNAKVGVGENGQSPIDFKLVDGSFFTPEQ
jgi:hypothetical protein